MTKRSFKQWWNNERVGRAEEGTSQDYCPTNGGAVLYAIGMCVFWGSLMFGIFRLLEISQ